MPKLESLDSAKQMSLIVAESWKKDYFTITLSTHVNTTTTFLAKVPISYN
jgi:hypothetical protein